MTNKFISRIIHNVISKLDLCAKLIKKNAECNKWIDTANWYRANMENYKKYFEELNERLERISNEYSELIERCANLETQIKVYEAENETLKFKVKDLRQLRELDGQARERMSREITKLEEQNKRLKNLSQYNYSENDCKLKMYKTAVEYISEVVRDVAPVCGRESCESFRKKGLCTGNCTYYKLSRILDKVNEVL